MTMLGMSLSIRVRDAVPPGHRRVVNRLAVLAERLVGQHRARPEPEALQLNRSRFPGVAAPLSAPRVARALLVPPSEVPVPLQDRVRLADIEPVVEEHQKSLVASPVMDVKISCSWSQ